MPANGIPLNGALRTRLDTFSFLAPGYLRVSIRPWGHALATGELGATYAPLFVSGINFAIGTPWEAIWNPSIAYPWATADQQPRVRSTSANDAAAGTGVRTVRVWWLNSANVLASEDVVMNGVNPVIMAANTVRRVNRVESLTYGGSGWNVGDVTVYWTDNATIFAQMPISFCSNTDCIQTVPTGYRDVITAWHISVYGGDTQIRILARSSPTAAWELLDYQWATGMWSRPLSVPFVLPAGTDYCMEGQSVAAYDVFATIAGYREAV